MRCAELAVASTSGGDVQTLVVNSATSCAPGQFVLLESTEFQQYLVSPFQLSLEDGTAISGAILLVWAAGFGIRLLIRTLAAADNSEQSSND